MRSVQDLNTYQHNKFIQSVISTPKKYIRVVEILLALIWVDGRGTITSKSRSFVVLQLVTNVALIEYTYNFLYILIAKIFRAERNSKLQPLLI